MSIGGSAKYEVSGPGLKFSDHARRCGGVEAACRLVTGDSLGLGFSRVPPAQALSPTVAHGMLKSGVVAATLIARVRKGEQCRVQGARVPLLALTLKSGAVAATVIARD